MFFKSRLYNHVVRLSSHAAVNSEYYDSEMADKEREEIISFLGKKYAKVSDSIGEKLAYSGLIGPSFKIRSTRRGVQVELMYEAHSLADKNRSYKPYLREIETDLRKFSEKAGIWMLNVRGPLGCGLEIINENAAMS